MMRFLNISLIGHEWLLQLFFGLISCVAIVTDAVDCIGGKTYTSLDVKTTSEDSITRCQNVGSTLVIPRSVEVLKNAEDSTTVDEFWINLFNNNRKSCKDSACGDEQLTTSDGQAISLGLFDQVEIKGEERCILSKKTSIKSVKCDHKTNVVCEKHCQVRTAVATSPNPAPCHNMDSVQSTVNQKFYKALDFTGGYQSAHKACAAIDMELADISTEEGIKGVHETLGTGPFWLSTYNPSAKACSTPSLCSSSLRNGYGSRIQYNALESNINFNIGTTRCVQATFDSNSIQLESLDCESTIRVACESSCALSAKGPGHNRCPIPPVGPYPITHETSESAFVASSTLELRSLILSSGAIGYRPDDQHLIKSYLLTDEGRFSLPKVQQSESRFLCDQRASIKNERCRSNCSVRTRGCHHLDQNYRKFSMFLYPSNNCVLHGQGTFFSLTFCSAVLGGSSNISFVLCKGYEAHIHH